MKVIFELPTDYNVAIEEISAQCGELCICEEKENLSGDQIIAIVAIITPIVWSLIEKYLSDPKVSIAVQFNEKTTVTISGRSVERAMIKLKKIKTEWEKINEVDNSPGI